MTATYILGGGNERKHEDAWVRERYACDLNEEITKRVKNPKILSCFFSTPNEVEWQDKYKVWQGWFSRNIDSVQSYEFAHVDTFLEQLKECDVLYIHGGVTTSLIDSLCSIGIDKTIFEDKIIIGSSAGSNCLSENFWSSTRGIANKGMGILRANIMVHFGATTLGNSPLVRTADNWQEEKHHFQQHIGAGKEIICLAEATFVVIEA